MGIVQKIVGMIMLSLGPFFVFALDLEPIPEGVLDSRHAEQVLVGLREAVQESKEELGLIQEQNRKLQEQRRMLESQIITLQHSLREKEGMGGMALEDAAGEGSGSGVGALSREASGIETEQVIGD